MNKPIVLWLWVVLAIAPAPFVFCACSGEVSSEGAATGADDDLRHRRGSAQDMATVATTPDMAPPPQAAPDNGNRAVRADLL